MKKDAARSMHEQCMHRAFLEESWLEKIQLN
jgi:hypothetical protein